ncbi:PhnD/SsuA/transferrin family substrate-binding protein [Azospirillum brasilense]|uniref:ABC transporter substrate-binding protein n=1 Tax=Azospirillum brasilense TaxID=192 RepID=UPI00190CFDA8|nr:ABC transporter substrate-binding protein [Azospirillum brasilense]MBK3731676.1 PhnD/SsuA/transferrin family substrate-binding protein [Azospirillum brasilense]
MSMMSRSLKAALLAGAFSVAMSTAALAADALKIGMPAKMFLNLVEFVAQDQGFYEKNGLTVELVHIADSSIPVRSLIAGELDVSQAGMSETLAAADKGGALKTIGGVHTGLHYAFYANAASGVKDVTDLPGKKVGISSPGSLPHVVITALMRQAGMSEDQIKSVQWVSLKGSSARINGILTGTIDATVSNYDPKAAHDKNAKVLFVVSKKLPNYVMTPWDVNDATIAKKRDVLKRFVKAELEATRWIFDNEKGALDVAKKHFDYNDEQLAEFYEFYKVGGIWNPNGTVTADQAKYMQELNVEGGLQKAVHPAEKVLDTSIVQEVLAEIGTYKQP